MSYKNEEKKTNNPIDIANNERQEQQESINTQKYCDWRFAIQYDCVMQEISKSSSWFDGTEWEVKESACTMWTARKSNFISGSNKAEPSKTYKSIGEWDQSVPMAVVWASFFDFTRFLLLLHGNRIITALTNIRNSKKTKTNVTDLLIFARYDLNFPFCYCMKSYATVHT